MNKEEILAMEAGRELDTLLVEKVFAGSKDYFIPDWSDVNWPYKWDMDGNDVAFKPSTDISDAWEVLGKMRRPFSTRKKFADAMYEIANTNPEDMIVSPLEVIWNMNPLNICKASLLAVME